VVFLLFCFLNPCTPRGVQRKKIWCPLFYIFVSIHAPLHGAPLHTGQKTMCFNPCTLAGCNDPWFAVFSKIYISTHAPLHGAPLQTRTETCFSRPQNYKINPLINLPAAASRSWASRPFVHPIPPFPPARSIRNHKRVNGPRHFLFFVFTTHIAPFWISSKTFGKLFKE